MAVIASVTLEQGARPLVRGAHRGDHRHLARRRPGLRQRAQPDARRSTSSRSPASSTASRRTSRRTPRRSPPTSPTRRSFAGFRRSQLIRRDRSVIVRGRDAPATSRRRRRPPRSSHRLDSRPAGADRAGNDQSRRRRDQAHRLRRHLSLSGAADRSARHAQPAADRGERRRIRAAAGEPVRRAGRLRASSSSAWRWSCSSRRSGSASASPAASSRRSGG